MSVVGIAYRKANQLRKLVKIDATGNIARYRKLGTTADQFNNAVSVVKRSSGKYSKNPLIRIYRFFKEFFKNYKELRKANKELKKANKKAKLQQKQQNLSALISETAAKKHEVVAPPVKKPEIDDLRK